MDDRTMLELAAKAAGLNARYFEEFAPGLKVFGDPVAWNPLEDDGDALRLAVKLRLSIHYDDLSPYVSVCADRISWTDVPYTDDPYAATRRAIVRAAAEVQLSKESGK